jgi:hypothetical protein
MYIMPLSVPQKVGVIFYGLAIGLLALMATTVAFVLVAFLVSAFFTVTHLSSNDGGGGFFVALSAFYGFYAGIVVGIIVCWRVWHSRLRTVPTQ